MTSSCSIVFFENPEGVYSPGQILSGRVNLVTKKVKAIKAVTVTIQGYAEVEWTGEEPQSGADGHSDTETITFSARDNYFSTQTNLFTSEDGNRFDLMPGEYEFDFQIKLPDQLPSSFCGKHGEIRYEVVCTINRPWRFNNVFKHPFTIVSAANLNVNPIYQQPVDRSTIKYFSLICCCGDGGNILLTGYIPHSGFAPGQFVPVKASIKNLSKIEYHEVKIKLIQMTEFRSCNPRPKSNYEKIVVTLKRFDIVDQLPERELNCNLSIPPLPPSSFSTCNIIEISYLVEIQLKTKGIHTNMFVRLPITIGTVPLFLGAAPEYSIVTSQPLSLQRGVNGNQFDGLLLTAPPSYEEAMKYGPQYIRKTDETERVTQTEFTPKYPVYHYSSENS